MLRIYIQRALNLLSFLPVSQRYLYFQNEKKICQRLSSVDRFLTSDGQPLFDFFPLPTYGDRSQFESKKERNGMPLEPVSNGFNILLLLSAIYSSKGRFQNPIGWVRSLKTDKLDRSNPTNHE